MAGKLRKQEGTQTLTFEVFDLDLNDDDRRALAADPRGFLDGLLAEEGNLVNDLLVSSNEKFLGPDGEPSSAGGGMPPSVWHCTSPPQHASKWITLVPHVGDAGGDKE